MLTSGSTAIVASNVVFMFLAWITVGLRLYTRWQRSKVLAADDYLIAAACFFSSLLAITNIVGVPVGGFGVAYEDMSEETAANFLKTLLILQFWYIIAVALVKLSVLCLYGRIFRLGRFPVVIKIFIVLVLGWLISFIFATLFQVWPIWCNWTFCVPTTNYSLMYVLCNVSDLVLDIAILCLPVSFIRKLNLNLNQKIGIALIFGLGIFCTVASIARLVYTVIYVNLDFEVDFSANFGPVPVFIIMWSSIEASASTICANLPCFSSVTTKARGLESFVAKVRLKSSHHLDRLGLRKKQPQKTTTSTENMSDESELPPMQCVIEGAAQRSTTESNLEMGMIKVKVTVEHG